MIKKNKYNHFWSWNLILAALFNMCPTEFSRWYPLRCFLVFHKCFESLSLVWVDTTSRDWVTSRRRLVHQICTRIHQPGCRLWTWKWGPHGFTRLRASLTILGNLPCACVFMVRKLSLPSRFGIGYGLVHLTEYQISDELWCKSCTRFLRKVTQSILYWLQKPRV